MRELREWRYARRRMDVRGRMNRTRKETQQTGEATTPLRSSSPGYEHKSAEHEDTVHMDAPVPLVDLGFQHDLIAETVERGWGRVAQAGAFVLGEEVRTFEQDFATFCGVEHCVGVASGTDALELALRAVGVGHGDEVIVPTNSFIASASAVVRAGAIPVLVDVDPTFLLIDPDAVAARLTPRTKAIIAVHLFGQMAPMEQLRRIGDGRMLIVEDAAQAQGASRLGIGAGGFGLATGMSFYPGKNLGAYGDAGAVLTGNDEVKRRVRVLRDHGAEVKYQHSELGFNSRLDAVQAVVLSAKLPFLHAWNEARREASSRYDELLRDLPMVIRPMVFPGNEHVWHLYVVRVPRRDEVVNRLHQAGIGAGIHYPVPIHLQGAFRELGYREHDFPVAEQASREILSLPIYPGITPDQQEHVVHELGKALR
jgi:dTDP-4-amino-4,6-dideoxygalactose transaminase